jgi:hypothetical protein
MGRLDERFLKQTCPSAKADGKEYHPNKNWIVSFAVRI